MRQKETPKPKVRKQAKRELNVRQAQVLTYLALGKRVREIARDLGVSDDSIRRDIRRLEETKTYDTRLKVELEKHCLLWNKAFACVEANLDNGNLKAAEDVMKYTGVWIDRLDVIAKVEPGDQQKKMMENMEALLKLSKDKVQGALPEMVKESKRVEAESMEKPKNPKAAVTNPKTPRFGQIVELPEQTGKETETQSQCSCPKGIDGEPLGAFSIDPKCPVHGDENKEQDENS